MSLFTVGEAAANSSAYQSPTVIHWQSHIPIYLHVDSVDFRKSINGLSVIVDEAMGLSPSSRVSLSFAIAGAINSKYWYWDKTGFALWYKRLEKDTFKWPRQLSDTTITLTAEQWDWLLRGLNFLDMKPHQSWTFSAVN